MGLGKAYKIKRPRKEWVDFSELEDLLDKLNMTNVDFMMITGTSESTFYIWKRKYKLPANTISKLREELAKYFKKQYDNKCKIIWGDNENTST